MLSCDLVFGPMKTPWAKKFFSILCFVKTNCTYYPLTVKLKLVIIILARDLFLLYKDYLVGAVVVTVYILSDLRRMMLELASNTILISALSHSSNI